MAVNSGMAHLSDTLFTTAIAIYAARDGQLRGRVRLRRGVDGLPLTARTTPAKVLVGAGAGESRAWIRRPHG